jgi:signal transduction histidine kinase
VHLNIVKQSQLPIAECNALRRADTIIGEAIEDCRTLAVELSPPILHDVGLGAALEWLARRMTRLHRFTVNLDIDSQAEPRSAGMRVCLFEALRELLHNSCRHSGCKCASVKMTCRPNHRLLIAVEDKGKGFKRSSLCSDAVTGEGFGLLNTSIA